jgi:hypothetical protein
MVFALMRTTADSRWNRRAAFAALVAFILIVPAGAIFAQGMDATDRQDKMDINREGANSRIGRIHQDQKRGEQQSITNKKSGTNKKRQQRLQY